MNKTMKGHLHVHTEYSINDSSLKVKSLVKRAKELNMNCLALTDHGTLLGIDTFLGCKEKDDDINLIPGVEAYVKVTVQVIEAIAQRLGMSAEHVAKIINVNERYHLVLLSKTLEGYKSICSITTEANAPENLMVINKKRQYPMVTVENILKNNQNKQIVGLSACIQGLISGILLKNVNTRNDLQGLVSAEDFATLTSRMTALQAAISESKKALSKAKKANEDTDKIENDLAYAELTLKNFEKEFKKKEKENEKRIALEALLVSDEDLYKVAVEMTRLLQGVFGPDDFYIEIQNHNMTEEAYVAPLLVRIAEEVGAKLVATNDVHILNKSQEDVLARSVMKFNGFGNWMEGSDSEAELYLKTEDEMRECIRRVIPVEKMEEAMNSIDEISAKCHVEFTRDYHYPTYGVEDAAAELTRCAFEGMYKRYAGHPALNEIAKKTQYELNVINKMGYADYLLIVKDFLEFGRKVSHMPYVDIQWLIANCKTLTLVEMMTYVEARMTEPGIGIGPGRGSAAGSIVCYETGITDIDPLKYDLMFERFLNPDRVSMPDIDSDFSFETRELCIEYCRKKYGQSSVCGITTMQTVAAKGSVRLVARAIISKMSENKSKEKAEEIQSELLGLADKIAKTIPSEVGMTLEKCMDILEEKFAEDKMAMSIIKTATLVEGTITNTGTHAAGIIISDKPVSEYISLMYDSKNEVYRTQCDMIEAEGIHGLLKMDFLGLRTLSVLTMTARQIKKQTGISIDIDKIDIEQEVIDHIFKPGFTSSVFQFSSAFMKQIIKKIKPDSIDDMILINAIGRPGPMQYIDPIAAVKEGKVIPEYIVPELESILGKTYGYPVYQEQIMQLMQFAGMTMGEADTIRRHMSKKHVDEFMEFQPRFVQGMIARGADEQKTIEFWDQLVDFSKYAFNKSHAAAYVVVAYLCAWFLYHYPAYFICASLEYCEKKEDMLAIMADAKALGIEILPPDVNKSEATFSVESEKAVRFGLTSIKGCGEALKEVLDHKQVYNSLGDLILKTRFGESIINQFIKAGACDGFNPNRKAMMKANSILSARLTEVKKVEKEIADKTAIKNVLLAHPELSNDMDWKPVFEEAGITIKTKNMPVLSKVNTSIQNKIEKLNEIIIKYNEIQIGSCTENKKERLADEYQALECYVSEHPVDSYELPAEATLLNNVTEGMVTVIGLVKDFRQRQTKKDGKPIGFFTLEDPSGELKCNCWSKEFEQYGDLITDGAVLIISGQAKTVEDDLDETKTKTELTVKDVRIAVEKTVVVNNSIKLHFNTMNDAMIFLATIGVKYADENGNFIDCIINNRQICTTSLRYNNSILLEVNKK